MDVTALGRLLILVGVVVIAVGLLLTFTDRIPLLGRLPGDFVIRGDRWTFYLPLGTSILISVILTLILMLSGAFGRR